jgi:hypothetical protein
MTALRVALIALGIGIAGYGVALVLDEPRVIMFRMLVWTLAGVVLHDLVFAPLSVALGFAGRRLVPQKWWGPVVVAALCSVVLVMLAVPVFDKPGMRPDNLTVLDRNYRAGLWISLAIVWACVPLYLLATRLLPPRKR